MNPTKMLEKALGGTTQSLGVVLDSIHGHMEVQTELLAKILYILEKDTKIKGVYDEDEITKNNQ